MIDYESEKAFRPARRKTTGRRGELSGLTMLRVLDEVCPAVPSRDHVDVLKRLKRRPC